MEVLVQREVPGLLLMENLCDPKYVHRVYRTFARQGERFAHVKEAALATVRNLTGLWAGSAIATNRSLPQ